MKRVVMSIAFRWRPFWLRVLLAVWVSLILPIRPAIAHPGHGDFIHALADHTLTPNFTWAGLAIAFGFGMVHTLSPGHGKTMVAAYLVGTRGTAKQALVLGLVTTITHTLGVFALGLVALVTSQYVLPDRLYPILSFISGLIVLGVGVWLLRQHLGKGTHHHAHHHHTLHPAHHHSHHSPDPHHDPGDEHHHYYDHGHHDDGDAHHHGHHHGLPDGDWTKPVTWRSLVTLGISGGLVPCPSALVLLMSAIALHQAAYGMLLVSAFSVGLASVLVALGLMVVYARQWLDRVPKIGPLQKYLPIVSSFVIIWVGSTLAIVSLL